MPQFYAPCAKGLEYLLVDELKAIGAEDVREGLAGVHFTGEIATAYRALTWSRLASRVLYTLKRFEIDNAEDVYEAARVMPWRAHIAPTHAIAIDFRGTNDYIRHTQFGAQRVKDAICDLFKEAVGTRPDVDLQQPNVRINAFLEKSHLTLSIDLAGHALHERGYRLRAGEAPLKETLACAMLMRGQWPARAARGESLVDPMCGSGTILIEAAWMAADIAPALLRNEFGCNNGWLLHDKTAWDEIRREAQQRADIGKQNMTSKLFGFDADERVLYAAESNAVRAGMKDKLVWTPQPLSELKRPNDFQNGLVICNPPYGERMGDVEALQATYHDLGQKMLTEFDGCAGAVITSEPTLAKAIALRSHKQYKLYNGALECQLYLFDIKPAHLRVARADKPAELSEAAQGLKNRLEKNRKGLSNWLKRDHVECYRVYDADIPEYSAAIDVYQDHLFIAEYAAPKTIEVELAKKRFAEIVEVARLVFDCPENRTHLRQRSRQKGTDQYQKRNYTDEFFTVNEGGLQFVINLDDYLDTGLFLDHRKTRAMVREWASAKHFLNLFCYTGSVSVYAAAGAAASTTSVDMSRNYIEWAEHNMQLNGFRSGNHQFVQANALEWLAECREGYDLIFVDPPTFSNSKRMEDVFDVQRDHVALLRRCLELLQPGGKLVFSNNFRKFKLDEAAFADCHVENISKQTIPTDYQRNPRIHQCWVIKRSSTPTTVELPG